ncbi:hypothetical protein CR513_60819, partial [Mucuna pruriens]
MIVFDDRDLNHGPARCNESMIISVVAEKYKIERVLIDQGSSTNILYWSMYQKLGLSPSKLNECSRTLYGFKGERGPIKGVIELEIVFRENSDTKNILVLYTIVDVEASYNIIIGAVVSTRHLCMKFPVGQRVESIWANSHLARHYYEYSLRVGSQPPQPGHPAVNVLDLDLDPWCRYEHERPHPAEDLKEIQVGPSTTHKRKIGKVLEQEEEAHLTHFLRDNNDIRDSCAITCPCRQELSRSSRRSISRERRNRGRPEKKRANCWQPVS